jgi:hypothetical protein
MAPACNAAALLGYSLADVTRVTVAAITCEAPGAVAWRCISTKSPWMVLKFTDSSAPADYCLVGGIKTEPGSPFGSPGSLNYPARSESPMNGRPDLEVPRVCGGHIHQVEGRAIGGHLNVVGETAARSAG